MIMYESFFGMEHTPFVVFWRAIFPIFIVMIP